MFFKKNKTTKPDDGGNAGNSDSSKNCAQNLWHVLFKNAEVHAEEYMEKTLREGKLIVPCSERADAERTGAVKDNGIIVHPDDSPLRVFAIVVKVDEKFHCPEVFPAIGDGAESELEILSVEEEEDPEDADSFAPPRMTITVLADDGKELTCFAPTNVVDGEILQPGRRFLFKLGALVYTMEKTEGSCEITDGPLLAERRKRVKEEGGVPESVKSISIFLGNTFFNRPNSGGDVEFISKISEMETFAFEGEQFYRLRVYSGEPGEGGVPVDLFVRKPHLKGSPIAVGDTVRGLANLQLIPIKEVSVDEPHAARHGEERAHMDEIMERFMKVEESRDYLASMSAAAINLAERIIMKGLSVEKFENPKYLLTYPDFCFSKGDSDYCVFVREILNGDSYTEPFSNEEKEKFSKMLKEKFTDVFFVECEMETSGNGYSFHFKNLDEIEKITGDLNSLIYEVAPENRKITKLGEPNDDSPAPFEPRSVMLACKKSFEEENFSYLAARMSELVEIHYENKEKGESLTRKIRYPVLYLIAHLSTVKRENYKDAVLCSETDDKLDFSLNGKKHFVIRAVEGVGSFVTKLEVKIVNE
jgi:hypothetical protein